MKIRQLLSNFSYTIFSNFVTLGVSTILILIVPKLIGIKAYGYWQLYMFYTSYAGVLAFGWIDDIYLRFGGWQYDELDKTLFHSQFLMILMSQLVISFFVFIYSLFNSDANMKFIFQMFAICLVLYNMRVFILYVLQDTNRIREYALINSIGRVIYFILAIVILLVGVRKYKPLIIADLIGRTTALFFGIYAIRDIVFLKLSTFYWSFYEAWLNISVGIKLLVANFAGLLIIGVVRYGIQMFWGVSVFGKVSLTLNISNLLMTFISAISLVLYPVLRRMSRQKAKNIYLDIREILMIVLFFGMFLYYPIDYLLPIWLPKYQDSLVYMALLFPMCIYQGKFELLVNTFLKTFRYEKALLNINLISLLISVVVTAFNVFFIHNLTVLMFSIILILWVQSSLGEFYLTKQLNISILGDIFLETVIVISFMLSGWLLTFPQNIAGYGFTFCFYVWIKRRKIGKGINYLKLNIGKQAQ
ncbi:hypothetical protein BSQ39_05120 [Loigolactobacillus backii]|uniref:hypothetical protein n=1 Tax=Loigolactobacillus backii TaxID=375175 RepID=UPI000C1CB75E|nr:hypothetical protein [Loigolactobacillus backii]PIO82998.1 hypothetical protein BSQ39_05120 [Loigolactobacillus backii]